MGRVRMMPMAADTMMPMMKGCMLVASMTMSPSHTAACPMGGARKVAMATPPMMVTAGVTIRSTGVRLETSLPRKTAITVTKNTARGPPAPPRALVE